MKKVEKYFRKAKGGGFFERVISKIGVLIEKWGVFGVCGRKLGFS